jgi:hypothetical protein
MRPWMPLSSGSCSSVLPSLLCGLSGCSPPTRDPFRSAIVTEGPDRQTTGRPTTHVRAKLTPSGALSMRVLHLEGLAIATSGNPTSTDTSIYGSEGWGFESLRAR